MAEEEQRKEEKEGWGEVNWKEFHGFPEPDESSRLGITCEAAGPNTNLEKQKEFLSYKAGITDLIVELSLHSKKKNYLLPI